MDFKEFNELVKTYYPLNKDKSRYLIMFTNGTYGFYKCSYDKKDKTIRLDLEKLKGGINRNDKKFKRF